MADFGLAAASLAASVVGSGLSAVAAQQQASARSQAAMYQAAVARNNQTLANQYAQAELDKGNLLEQEKRREIANREGAIRAEAGASGVDVNSGSALRLQSDTASVGEYDAQQIRSAAQRAAYGYRVKGMDYAAQAGLDEMTARSASEAGALGEWSSIIGGASSVSDKWLSYKLKGIF